MIGDPPRVLGPQDIAQRVEDAVRPLLRGWSHLAAVVPASAGALLLVVESGQDPVRRIALGIYGAALVLLFGISALYHRGRWSPRMHAVWRRIDHANIFLMIAATYTAVAATVLSGGARVGILIAVWSAAIIGMALVTTPLRLPRAIEVTLYVLIGWMAVVV
ncbi:MAG: hemolysin III family protein, partial [Candidatus Dormibacteraeota bacterium]|nr:hemolysin III family protein [Candidatus Dormibacteraeota bacterium]